MTTTESNRRPGPITSAETGELMGALIKLRGMVGTLARNKGVEVPHKAEKGGGRHEFKYTTADEQFEVTLEPLETCKLAVSQPTDQDEQGRAIVWTLVTHVDSQQWIAGRTPLIPSSGGMQAYSAALSSARRVGLNAILGLVSGDKEESSGYDVRKARQPRTGKREAPSPEFYLRAIEEARDVNAIKPAIEAGRHALAGFPSAGLIEAAGVTWFRKRIDASSESVVLDQYYAALADLNLAGARGELAATVRAAAGRVAKPGQVPT